MVTSRVIALQTIVFLQQMKHVNTCLASSPSCQLQFFTGKTRPYQPAPLDSFCTMSTASQPCRSWRQRMAAALAEVDKGIFHSNRCDEGVRHCFLHPRLQSNCAYCAVFRSCAQLLKQQRALPNDITQIRRTVCASIRVLADAGQHSSPLSAEFQEEPPAQHSAFGQTCRQAGP